MYHVTSFYKFTHINDPEAMRLALHRYMKDNDIFGTIILAKEGINGTIASKKSAVIGFEEFMHSLPEFHDLLLRNSETDIKPFDKQKVRVKQEIVSIRQDLISESGTYIEPDDWDDFIARDDVVLIDTRNDYEYHLGTFNGAINPNIKHFREFPKWVKDHAMQYANMKIATFCTGGIRCEKATRFMRDVGLNDVYHLHGGILNYILHGKPHLCTQWIGDCFVFDNRLIVKSNNK